MLITIAILIFIGGGILALKFARDFKRYDNEGLSDADLQKWFFEASRSNGEKEKGRSFYN
jgi:hypothetical protein